MPRALGPGRSGTSSLWDCHLGSRPRIQATAWATTPVQHCRRPSCLCSATPSTNSVSGSSRSPRRHRRRGPGHAPGATWHPRVRRRCSLGPAVRRPGPRVTARRPATGNEPVGGGLRRRRSPGRRTASGTRAASPLPPSGPGVATDGPPITAVCSEMPQGTEVVDTHGGTLLSGPFDATHREDRRRSLLRPPENACPGSSTG